MKTKELLHLSLKGMGMRKTRTRFTIFGMALGVGVIIFLLSIGYGIQNLVISEVASLESLKITDVSSGDLRSIKIKDEILEGFEKIEGVKKVSPLVSLVGRLHFESAVSDVVVFGASENYLKLLDAKILHGDFYQDDDIKLENKEIGKKETDESKKIKNQNKPIKVGFKNIIKEDIKFNVEEGEWIKVRAEPRLKAQIIGYTKKNDNFLSGSEVFGSTYLSDLSYGKFFKDKNGEWYGKWILAEVSLWEKKGDNYEPILKEKEQLKIFGYFGENGILIQEKILAEVVEQKIVQSESDNGSSKPIVLGGENGGQNTAGQVLGEEKNNLTDQIVINELAFSLIGSEVEEVINKEVSLSFVLTGLLGEKIKETVETEKKQFKIAGIISEGESPQIYLPLSVLREEGVDNFSQAKVEVQTKNYLPDVRQQIENMGYQTASVADTIDEIDQIFVWVQIALLSFGMVALIVASFGMFNTLTVSLLERTKEIGVMKAIGMKRKEVVILFLGEAGIMGFGSGVLGVILGFLIGKVFDVVVNIFFVTQGEGFIFISSVPILFASGIIVLTLVISLITGVFPALRAAKISPLTAIKYE